MKDETRSKKQLIEELASFRRRISRLESEKARLSVLVDRNMPESAEKAQYYLDVVQDMIVELDRSGKVVQINKRGCEILGYKEKEIIGKNWFDNYLPEYFGPEVKSVFKELMSGKLKAQAFFENPIITKSGEERLIAWHNIILKEPKGKITGAISSGLDITDEFYASEALKESEERFSKIATHTQAIIFIIDNDGKFVLSEGKGLFVLGLKPGEAVGKSAYEMYKDFPTILKGIKSALKGKTYEDVIDVNGIKFDIFYTPYRNSAGDIIGLIGMASDITAHKQAEGDLREGEERYRAIWENSPIGMCLIDKDGIYRNVNSSYCNLYGFSKDELIGHLYVEKLLRPGSQDGRLEAHKKLFDVGKPISLTETEFIKKNGEHVWIQYTADFIREEGTPKYLVAMNVDITDRTMAVETMRESEEKYRTLIEQSNDAIYLIVDGKLEFVNRRFIEMFGFSEEELLSSDFDIMNLVSPSSREHLEQRQKTIPSGGEAPYRYEFTATNKKADKIQLEVSVSYISYKGTRAIQGIIHDMSEQKKLEAQLLQSQKMESIGRLAGGIAHDFNNLLTAITGHSELAAMRLKQDDPLMEDIRIIQRASDRAADLISQLLAFSRRQALAPKIINLNDVIESMSNMLKRIIGEDINLKAIKFNGLWKAKVDPGQIEQVIVNLAVNARDAMPEGGVLTIETANADLDADVMQVRPEMEPGPYVMLSVSDSGTGITDEIKEKIFEPFFTTKELGKGTGLGLSTVYGIIKQSGGFIWVYSEENKGTSFKIYLPMVEGRAEPVERALETEEVPGGTETIMIVEDDEIVRGIVTETLKLLGYKIIDAVSGGDALLLCEKMDKPVDLVLTDVVMPNMSGTELIERLRKIWPDLNALYMSGYTENAIVHQGVLDPGIPYLQKPFKAKALAIKVRQALDEE